MALPVQPRHQFIKHGDFVTVQTRRCSHEAIDQTQRIRVQVVR